MPLLGCWGSSAGLVSASVGCLSALADGASTAGLPISLERVCSLAQAGFSRQWCTCCDVSFDVG